MASQNKPNKPAGDSSDASSGVNTEDSLRPFQDAAAKFLQAHFSAQESFMKQRAQACLDLQEGVRKVEQEAHQAVMDVTRRHIQATGQPATGQAAAGGVEAAYAARVQAQLDYEKEVRQIHADAQAKVMALVQKAQSESFGEESVKNFASQRQGAYQAYLEDLQRAWSGTKALDPRTLNAIASTILMTMNAAS